MIIPSLANNTHGTLLSIHLFLRQGAVCLMFQILKKKFAKTFSNAKLKITEIKIELNWIEQCVFLSSASFGWASANFGNLRKCSSDCRRGLKISRVIRDLQKDWSDFSVLVLRKLALVFVFFRIMNDELIGYLRYYNSTGHELCKIYLSVEKLFLRVSIYFD